MNKIQSLGLLLILSTPSLQASTGRDALRIVSGLALIYIGYVCFQHARTAATNLAADPEFIAFLREHAFTRQLVALLPEKTLSDLTASGFETIRVSLGNETTQARIAKLCGWSIASLLTSYGGFSEFLKGLRGECKT